MAMTMATDPVCGMQVDTATARHTSEYRGRTYYFCAAGCKRAFDAAPDDYTGRTQEGLR
jgi:P-type Cu+ transporter